MNTLQVATAFVEAINSGNLDRMMSLTAPDHVFIDSDGTHVSGRERLRGAWEQYFAMVPDFRIEVAETFIRNDTVVLLGTATGTFSQDGVLRSENRWSVPAAWRIVMQGETVAVWQLYVNPEPMQRILKRIAAS